ncbi:unnamed protein product [Mytilus coruscus]|uniref:Schlafen AlbA-2 domain-containing protein n=1 Tax=Mytilus coruscus TaxID=42192 RepID=A0A6J8EDC2_MYTCO|nr:unnamed protein product [Mytilus coruscus]
MSTEFVIEVNNLKRENDTILKKAIQDVLKKLNVNISVDNLEIEECGETKSAIIYLQSIDEVREINDSINNNGFKFTQIAKPYKKISAKRIQSKRPLTVYEYEEYLGDETRHREFKEGGGNIEENFLRTGQKRCLANYACGIVNNREKGTVYVGVNDKGRVVGLRCNHEKRDRLRRRIAQIMKCDLNPPLSTIHYSVKFVPVHRTDGYELGDIFVLEITFYTVDKFSQLYTVNGEVYQKSDACLFGPLRPAEILEWEAQIIHKQMKEARNIELQEIIEKYEIDKAEKKREIDMYKKMNEEEKIRREEKELSFKRKKEEFETEVSRLKQIHEDKERSFKRNTDQLIAEREEKEKENYQLQREKSKLVKENKTLIHKSKVCVLL